MELISIKEFGRRVEISDTIIRRYIEKGKIGPDAIQTNKKNGRPEIKFIEALQYWSMYNNIQDLQYIIDNPEILSELILDDKKEEDEPKEEKAKKSKKESKKISAEQLSILDSEKRHASAKAQLAEINLEKAMGNLLSKDKINKALHSFGAQIRIALEAIPDRSIDSIWSAEDRSEAHLLLTNEIKNVLLMLTEIDSKTDIGQK